MAGKAPVAVLNRLLAGLAIAGLLAVPVRGEPVHPDDPLAEQTRARLHMLRVRIQPTSSAEPGSCLDLDADQLRVTLRGKRVEDALVELDRERKPTVHALLVDTSGSMAGHLAYVRRAAVEYVNQLRPDYESALVMSFDDSVVLHQGVTSDRDRLARAAEGVRMGGTTAALDALVYAIWELDSHRERPVLLLLTDGVDMGSLNEREDVRQLVRRRPGLTVFTIGLALPPLMRGGPPGLLSNKRFLERLALSTNGKFFDAPTPTRLGNVYRKIREMLDNEATLTVVDPSPDLQPVPPKVSSERHGCRVQLFRTLETPRAGPSPEAEPLQARTPELPHRIGLAFSEVWDFHLNAAHHRVDSTCGARGIEADRDRLSQSAWFAVVEPDRIRGCALDLTMEPGWLYDPFADGWASPNAWVKLATRPFQVPVSDPRELPRRPEQVMERLAEYALQVADREVATDPRKRPPDKHARPYHDWPLLSHGRMFLELRPRIARALFAHPFYRQWVTGQLREEADRDLLTLKERFRRSVPAATDEALMAAVYQSEQGRRILRRAEAPRDHDLQGYLTAWLGDLRAHDLFVRWEVDRLNRDLIGSSATPDSASFFERWRELRRLFFVPSYARVLTLLTPVYDDERERIGFYRALLPHPAWFMARLKGYKNHEWTDLPLDLLPDLPLGYWALERIVDDSPELAEHLRVSRYRVTALRYELLEKPGKQTPVRAFRSTRIHLELQGAAGPAAAPASTLGFQLDVSTDKTTREPSLEAVRFEARGDPAAELLIPAARQARTGSGLQFSPTPRLESWPPRSQRELDAKRSRQVKAKRLDRAGPEMYTQCISQEGDDADEDPEVGQ